jgi:4-carboxymuconolactone decarboxylase
LNALFAAREVFERQDQGLPEVRPERAENLTQAG